MPSWNEIAQEIVQAGQAQGIPADFDGVRRAKIAAVEAITGIPLVVYAVDTSNAAKTAGNPLGGLLNWDDRDAFLEALQGIEGDALDVLLHSPGGLAEATETIVVLLRNRFRHVRFIVPSFAKSAATMLALSGDAILMDDTAELGPIDPQMALGNGGYAPAGAILDQFAEARSELQRDPSALPVWLPILQQYGPALLQQCRNQIALSEDLVSDWLRRYMLKGKRQADQRAREVAATLNDHTYWKSHARRVGIQWLTQEARLTVLDLGSQPELQDAVRALHLAIRITFGGTGAFKIVENAAGNALIQAVQIAAPVQPMLLQMPGLPPTPPP